MYRQTIIRRTTQLFVLSGAVFACIVFTLLCLSSLKQVQGPLAVGNGYLATTMQRHVGNGYYGSITPAVGNGYIGPLVAPQMGNGYFSATPQPGGDNDPLIVGHYGTRAISVPATTNHYPVPLVVNHYSMPATVSHYSMPATISHYSMPATVSHFSDPLIVGHYSASFGF